LNQAEATLQKQEESLQILTEQIKKMEHHASVLQRQRDMYAAAVGGLVGYIVVDKIC
jgi:hypothetical protein